METSLRQRIAAEGPLGFRDFMEMALYHDPGGYYARPGAARVGRAGDFVTSVSIGPVFGMLLAERVAGIWEANGRPPEIAVVEPGPESGHLARDILNALATRHPECRAAVHYHLIEPIAAKHPPLREALDGLGGGKLHLHQAPGEIHAPFGVIIANEILDALPVHLVTRRGDRWLERCVAVEGDRLAWHERECRHPGVLAVLAPHSAALPDGYTTEVCLEYESFLASLRGTLDRGHLILIDYGFSSRDYYQSARTGGTLRVYRRHQAIDDPLAAPGECDITAHVDFSRVLAHACRLGFRGHGFYRQEQFLTPLAAPLLLDSDSALHSDPSLLRQFRTLTHPAMPGGRFHVLELSAGSVEASPFPFSHLAYLEE